MSGRSVPKDTHVADGRRASSSPPRQQWSPLVGDNTAQVEPHSLRVTSHESVIHAAVDTNGALIIPTQYSHKRTTNELCSDLLKFQKAK